MELLSEAFPTPTLPSTFTSSASTPTRIASPPHHDVWQVTDSSIQGIGTWFGLQLLIILVVIIAFEVLRGNKVLQRIFSTRVHALK